MATLKLYEQWHVIPYCSQINYTEVVAFACIFKVRAGRFRSSRNRVNVGFLFYVFQWINLL